MYIPVHKVLNEAELRSEIGQVRLEEYKGEDGKKLIRAKRAYKLLRDRRGKVRSARAVNIHIYIYIYIERDRERDRER